VRREPGFDDPLGRFPLRPWTALRGRWFRYIRWAEWGAQTRQVRLIAAVKGDSLWRDFPWESGYELRYVDADGNVTFPRPGARELSRWGAVFALPTAPGLGVTVDEDALERVATAPWSARLS